jgi:hypothetical protein
MQSVAIYKNSGLIQTETSYINSEKYMSEMQQ